MAAIEILFHNISSKTTFIQVFEIKIDNLRLTSSVFSSEANNLLTFIATGQSLGFNHNVLKHFDFQDFFFDTIKLFSQIRFISLEKYKAISLSF